MNDNYFDSAGWHPTSPLGVIAATAAVSKLLSLDEKETIFSLSIASSLASGLRENFGTMTKPFHIGTAAKNGIISTLLAKMGLPRQKMLSAENLVLSMPFLGGIPIDKRY